MTSTVITIVAVAALVAAIVAFAFYLFDDRRDKRHEEWGELAEVFASHRMMHIAAVYRQLSQGDISDALREAKVLARTVRQPNGLENIMWEPVQHFISLYMKDPGKRRELEQIFARAAQNVEFRLQPVEVHQESSRVVERSQRHYQEAPPAPPISVARHQETMVVPVTRQDPNLQIQHGASVVAGVAPQAPQVLQAQLQPSTVVGVGQPSGVPFDQALAAAMAPPNRAAEAARAVVR